MNEGKSSEAFLFALSPSAQFVPEIFDHTENADTDCSENMEKQLLKLTRGNRDYSNTKPAVKSSLIVSRFAKTSPTSAAEFPLRGVPLLP
jgi:hypothetical protein